MIKEIVYEFVMWILQAILISCIVLAGLTFIEFEHEPDNLATFIAFNEDWIESHDFDSNHYNCVNYSQDMHLVANLMDIDSEMMVGCPANESDNICHQWLRITLDYSPQHAEFKNNYADKYPRKRRIVT